MINTECVGKDGCTLDKFDGDFYKKKKPSSAADEKECFGDGSQVFVQVACVLDEGEVADR